MNKTYKYLGDCRRLRDAGHEEEWQHMMKNHYPIDIDTFVSACDIVTMLEPDNLTKEDYTEGLCEFISSDPGSNFYSSR